MNRWSCAALRSSPTTVSRFWPTLKPEMESAAMFSTFKPGKTVSVLVWLLLHNVKHDRITCNQPVWGACKGGSGLYLKLMTKAYLCWRAPLAVLMRIKRLWVHGSLQRGGWRRRIWEGGGVGCSLEAYSTQESAISSGLHPLHCTPAIGKGINSSRIREN